MVLSGVLKSLFSDLHFAFLAAKSENEGLRTVCGRCFMSLACILEVYYEDNPEILDPVLEIFLKCANSNNEVSFLDLELALFSVFFKS